MMGSTTVTRRALYIPDTPLLRSVFSHERRLRLYSLTAFSASLSNLHSKSLQVGSSMYIRQFLLPKLHSSARRFYAHDTSPLNVKALDKWIALDKEHSLRDTLSADHLADLYITLPTRDGSIRPAPCRRPQEGATLDFGHELVFCHPRNPVAALRPDGSDGDFCPPQPFTRRMWASGSFKWQSPLIVGEEVEAQSTVTSVEKKGFEKGSPMVFVNQTIEYRRPGHHVPSTVEERSHVYLPPGLNKRSVREVKDLPSSSDFQFTFTPNATTLFRFSALTFNGHQIHLDKDFAQQVEGYPERLVHGPLTALMLLETVKWHHPSAILASFEYRARNPIIVNREVTIHGIWIGGTSIELWTLDPYGVVGMTGRVTTA